MRILFCLSFLTLSFFSCIPDDQYEEAPELALSNIDSALQLYFKNFEDEAKLRGIEMDLSDYDLTGKIAEIHENNVAGVCHYSSNQPNRITIDQGFWNNASSLLREMVVFHELGHCVLARGHREVSNQNGHCLSIMRSGTGSCITLYNTQNRKFYLDELFFYEE